MVPREESDETMTEVDETSAEVVGRVEVGADVVTGATVVVD